MSNYRLTLALCASVLVTLMTSVVGGDFSHTCNDYDQLRPIGICGNHLSSIMSTVCGGIYNSRHDQLLALYHKRSADTLLSDGDIYDEGDADSERISSAAARYNPGMGSPFLDKASAVGFLALDKRATGPQGIICECCYHMCSFRELREYCSGEKGKRIPPHRQLIRRLSELDDRPARRDD